MLLPVLVLGSESTPQLRGPVADHSFDALVDTGATKSMISQAVVQRLKLPLEGVDNFIPATGVLTDTTLHRIALAVPTATESLDADGNGAEVTELTVLKDLLVLKMPKPIEGFDVVIGMDVLMDFRIQMHNGVFTISNQQVGASSN